MTNDLVVVGKLEYTHMTFPIDKNYHKEYIDYQHTLRIKYPLYSLSSLLIINFGKSFISILLSIVLVFTAPLMPSPRYGYGIKVPATLNNYVLEVLDIFTALVVFFSTIIFIVSLTQYLRTHFEYKAGYIKTGSFKVTKITNRGDFKVVRLNSRRILKIENTNEDFRKLRMGQTIEIKKTASNRLIRYRLLT